METVQEQYVVDTKGKKLSVILSLERYERLMEDLHDLAIVAERRDGRQISLEEMKRRMKKDFRRLPKSVVEGVMTCIEKLKDEPFPHGVEKLEGTKRLYRVAVGDYRIVYEVDTQANQIMILHMRHHRDVYGAL